MCEESLSFFILLSSNHPDPETEDIVDIYSAAITDKRQWNGENGRTESVIGLLFKDGHYKPKVWSGKAMGKQEPWH